MVFYKFIEKKCKISVPSILVIQYYLHIMELYII